MEEVEGAIQGKNVNKVKLYTQLYNHRTLDAPLSSFHYY